jgi:hypothetical protein
MVITLVGAWVLMPFLGIVGVGVAWLGAQTIGAIASLPAYAQIREPVTLSAKIPGYDSMRATETNPHLGIALLIELAEHQSLDRLSSS